METTFFDLVVGVGKMELDNSENKTVCGSSTKANQPEPAGAPDTSNLAKLGWEYAGLQLQVKFLEDQQRRLWPGEAWTEEVEARCYRTVDPLKDRMVEIRWIAAELRATDLLGLQAKARMLQDIVDDDPGDIRARLTLSLCRDLISFPLSQASVSFSDIAHSENRGLALAESLSGRIEPAAAS